MMKIGGKDEVNKDRRNQRLKTKNDEQILLELLRRGDSDGLKLIMQKYHGQLFSVAIRICNNHADTDEVLQDVYWTLFSKFDRFEERSTLATWLYRITVNASLMKLRSQRMNKNTLSMENLTTSLSKEENALRPDEPAKSPRDILMRKEFYEHIGDSVETLPETYREVFFLRDIYGFSIKETSMLLKITPAAIKSRLHRSRSSIRKDLGQYLHEY
jgi:RNA polymerase sigma-70 factor (ECF subfamily)